MTQTLLVPRVQPREPEADRPRRSPGERFVATGPFDGKGMPFNQSNCGHRMQTFEHAIIGGLDTASFGLSGDAIVAIGASNYNSARFGHGEIKVGDRIELLLPHGHPALYHGDEAVVVKLCSPFTEHCTDDIVQVRSMSGGMGWVKIHELEKLEPFCNPLDCEKSQVINREKTWA